MPVGSKDIIKIPLSEVDGKNALSFSSPLGRSGGALYIHIPFCKQACHYCDFHFSTSLKKKDELVEMLCQELILRKNEIGEEIETIYLGGGTPSLLSRENLEDIFETIYSHFKVKSDAEITLEANPDDLDQQKLINFKESGINRLSIGVQSFFEDDLQLMNRAHNASEALNSITLAKKYFDNISIDLIYGIPGMDNEKWERNIQQALDLGIPHFSCYALTVELSTALRKLIDSGKIKPVDDEVARQHFDILLKKLSLAGFTHYEFSNFGKTGYFSQNNTAYWFGKPYLGIGPSAHSYNGTSRRWNVSNNSLYINSIRNKKLPFQEEILEVKDVYNEYIMTRLRTMWGINLEEMESKFGEKFKDHFLTESKVLLESGSLVQEGSIFIIPNHAKFLSDGIASELFFVD